VLARGGTGAGIGCAGAGTRPGVAGTDTGPGAAVGVAGAGAVLAVTGSAGAGAGAAVDPPAGAGAGAGADAVLGGAEAAAVLLVVSCATPFPAAAPDEQAASPSPATTTDTPSTILLTFTEPPRRTATWRPIDSASPQEHADRPVRVVRADAGKTRDYGSGGRTSSACAAPIRSKSTDEYWRSFVSRWKPSIIRSVPDFDRITIDCVWQPPDR
jgi:hypothetical protein